MYKSISELGRELSTAQLELLLLLGNGFDVVTNEGAGYRSWLELDRMPATYKFLNATADKLLGAGLMKSVDEEKSWLFRYQISKKGEDVLDYVNFRKPERLIAAIRSSHRKGIQGITYQKVSS